MNTFWITINYNTFSNRAEATLYVPVGCGEAYRAANYWKHFKEIIEMEWTPTRIDTISPDYGTGQEWYSTIGTRLNSHPTRKGIYIRGGKKYVVK